MKIISDVKSEEAHAADGSGGENAERNRGGELQKSRYAQQPEIADELEARLQVDAEGRRKRAAGNHERDHGTREGQKRVNDGHGGEVGSPMAIVGVDLAYVDLTKTGVHETSLARGRLGVGRGRAFLSVRCRAVRPRPCKGATLQL